MMNLIRCTALALMLMPVAGAAQNFDTGLAAWRSGDYATALREWTPLAEQGHADAQSNLGVMYAAGEGVPQDYVEAVRWYRLAAEQGDVFAQMSLGFLYENDRGVPQDYVTAHMWFNIVAENGGTNAAESRDKVTALMTSADISEAQRRARVCIASEYQDCD